MRTAVCTLFENDYHYGVGALANSLYRNGFRGKLWIGYRASRLPDWVKKPIQKQTHTEWAAQDDLILCFVPMNPDYMLNHAKPLFLKQLLEELEPEARAAMYFDSDIVIKTRWSFFEEWVEHGLALCEAMTLIGATHPTRHAWKEIIERWGYPCKNIQHPNYNAGYIGLKREHIPFLDLWDGLIQHGLKESSNHWRLKTPDRSLPLSLTDQDPMNMAIMAMDCPVSSVPPDGMDLLRSGYIMSHAVGAPKPWQKSPLLRSLLGWSPSKGTCQYWKYANHPIRIYSKPHLCLKKMELFCAQAFSGLVWARNYVNK